MTTTVLVDYIDQHRNRFGVEPICTVLRKAGMQIAPEQLLRREDQATLGPGSVG